VQDDWKAFWIENPWLPRRIIQSRFLVKKHQIDGWFGKPQVAQVINLAKWGLSHNQTPENLQEIFTRAWRFYLEQGLKIDLASEDAVRQLIKIKRVVNSDFSFLVNTAYVRRIPHGSAGLDKGYTAVSFGVCKLYPGDEYAETNGLIPILFLETFTKAMSEISNLGLIEHIYLKLINKVSSSTPQGQIDNAKKMFYVRHNEEGFFNFDLAVSHGLGTKMLQGDSFRGLKSQLAEKFAEDLGYTKQVEGAWVSNRFRNSNPGMKLSTCNYCDRAPVDLHHLLPRSDYPRLMYELENVVPLCTMVHSIISRNTWSDDEKSLYGKAIRDWKTAKSGSKKDAFLDVMSILHRAVYD